MNAAAAIAGYVAAASIIASIAFLAGCWWATRRFTAIADHFDLHPEDYGS